MVRVFFVVTLAATGAYAFSMSAEEGPQTEASAAADAQHETADALPSAGQADRIAPVQVATAETAEAQAAMDAASPVTVPEEPRPQPAAASADAAGDQTVADAAASNPEPAPSEAAQAAAEPAPSADADRTGAVAVATAPTEPEPASDLVDLNAASFEELNSLRNTGPLGRAIIKHRPYASVEDLVTRKIVRRSVYEKIKDQVTVR